MYSNHCTSLNSVDIIGQKLSGSSNMLSKIYDVECCIEVSFRNWNYSNDKYR